MNGYPYGKCRFCGIRCMITKNICPKCEETYGKEEEVQIKTNQQMISKKIGDI